MAEIKMQAEYGGYIIEWLDDQRFTVTKNGTSVKSQVSTLDACQRWIDKKNKQKFKRVAVLHNVGYGYNSKRTPGEATSIIDGDYAWISSGKERRKARMSDVWLDTPKNRAALAEVSEKNKQISTLTKEIKDIESSTERLTAELMIEL